MTLFKFVQPQTCPFGMNNMTKKSDTKVKWVEIYIFVHLQSDISTAVKGFHYAQIGA